MVPPPEAIREATDALILDYTGILINNAARSYLAGQTQAVKLLKIPLDFNLVNTRAMNKIAAYRTDLVARGGSVIGGEFKPWLRDMGQTARDAVTRVVEDGIKRGSSIRDLTRELRTVFTAQEHDARLVAYQETRRLYTEGTFDRFNEEGVQQGRWHHMDPQENPREEHQDRDGQIYDIDDPIWNDLEDYNCHCWCEPVIGGLKA